jgi:curved DNA-binding protein CbpA
MEEIKTPAAVSHYQVLNLTQSLVDSHHNPSTLIKRAYHRALLQNHPDKAARSPASSSTFYSVDQITAAYTVLSSPRDRAAYDASARLSQQQQQHGGGQDDPASVQFRTGVENVDLDDLPFDEGKDVWYRSCRCGNDRGYVFGEDDLEEVGGEGELMVGCLDCSLWLNVHFAQVDNDDTAGTYRSWPLELPTCASTAAGDLPSSVNKFLICRPRHSQSLHIQHPCRSYVQTLKDEDIAINALLPVHTRTHHLIQRPPAVTCLEAAGYLAFSFHLIAIWALGQAFKSIDVVTPAITGNRFMCSIEINFCIFTCPYGHNKRVFRAKARWYSSQDLYASFRWRKISPSPVLGLRNHLNDAEALDHKKKPKSFHSTP